ncbi:MAG: 5-oxoprolinase subunit PxpB, partial [Firmicutes bacterium]|nr:5-oxoprolinase subunit PxpB [Bacillota bacterium]
MSDDVRLSAEEGRPGALYPRTRPVGDRHLTLELGCGIDPLTSAWVYRTEAVLRETAPPGLGETTPTYASLLVRYDPTASTYAALARVCLEAALVARDLAAREVGTGGPRGPAEAEVVVPVVYGGEWGPDLADVARHSGLSPEEVVRRHSGTTYRVYMMGFAPGFAYLGGLDPALETPRLDQPRPRVPEGSVGIAGSQTGVYPASLPGGWRIIGRTPLRLWRPEAARPAVLAPGKRVRFLDCGWGPQGWERAKAVAPGLEAEQDGSVVSSEVPPAGPGSGATTTRPVARVVRAGPQDTVQDAGRWGYSRLALPESGALDWPSLAVANLAVGNPAGAAGLESAYGNLVLEFLTPTVVAVSPGAVGCLDGRPLPLAQAVHVRAGQRLELGPARRPRVYVAFAGGGVAVPPVLGSRATYLPSGLGGLEGRALRAGDVLAAGDAPPQAPDAKLLDWVMASAWAGTEGDETEVRAVPGPQHDVFPDGGADFFSRAWQVLPASDRRACLLGGEPLCAPRASAVSDGSPAGSVQVPPSGLPVVLLADHQTT